MATAYRYTGSDAREYPTLGFRVEPGDVLYLEGKPPDLTVFVEAEAGSMETGDAVPDVGADWRASTHPTSLPLPEVKQPNKAASQADWVEYAKADGSFQEATGTAPEDATRKAIVEHYATATDPAAAGNPGTEPAPEPTPTPAPEPAADPAATDTPKEV